MEEGGGRFRGEEPQVLRLRSGNTGHCSAQDDKLASIALPRLLSGTTPHCSALDDSFGLVRTVTRKVPIAKIEQRSAKGGLFHAS